MVGESEPSRYCAPAWVTQRISHSLKEQVTRAQLQAVLATSCTRTQYSCRDCGGLHFGTHKTTGVAVPQRDVGAMSPSLATISRVQQMGKAPRNAPNTRFAYLVILSSRDSAAHNAGGAVAPLVNLNYQRSRCLANVCEDWPSICPTIYLATNVKLIIGKGRYARAT